MKLMLLTLALALIASGVADARAKKLIEYGWDVPDTVYMREHIAEMEQVPFDGVVFKVHPPPGTPNMREFGWRAFSKEDFDPAQLESAAADLKATKFRRFRDNFVQLVAFPGSVDWFDPAWSAAARNAGILARFARETGCKGLMFDPEPYEVQLWTYTKFPAAWNSASHTFEEYQAKVRERGREFMTAINKEYPNITLLCLFGPSAGTTLWPGKPEEHFFGLLRWFYQGMLDVATPQTVIVDGWEASYGYRSREQFTQARKTILTDTASFYDDSRRFAKNVRCGFGVWADYDWRGFGWDYKDLTRNYHSPAGLRASLNYALEECDGYVWVYSEELKWWNPARAPQAYVDALALCKTGPGEPNPANPSVRAALQRGYSDAETFADFAKTMTEVLDLPKSGWKWSRDPDKTGIVNGWHKPGLDDAGWKSMNIGKFWEEQGENYDGCAWYRGKFAAPAIDAAKRVYLCVGAADETAMVWVNGRYAGKHDVGPEGWDKAFSLDVTGILLPGQENTIAVRVIDTTGCGGLWKSIKLMVE